MTATATGLAPDAGALDECFAEYRRTRDRDLRNAIVEGHMPLAQFLARRFAHRGEPYDDLVQVALLGLLKAVERFDPGRGLQFSTFATPTVVGELKRHFRDKAWALRLPRRLQEIHLEVGKLVAELGQELGRSPTPAEVAERAGVSEEQVLEAMEAGSAYRLPSLDAPAGNDETTRLATLAGEQDPDLERVEHGVELSGLLDVLPARERRILYLRFFEGLTQSEIAGHVGISQMHVSRLLARSLDTMRDRAAEAARS